MKRLEMAKKARGRPPSGPDFKMVYSTKRKGDGHATSKSLGATLVPLTKAAKTFLKARKWAGQVRKEDGGLAIQQALIDSTIDSITRYGLKVEPEWLK